MLCTLFICLFAVTASASIVAEREYTNGWTKGSPVEDDQQVSFTIAVRERGIEKVSNNNIRPNHLKTCNAHMQSRTQVKRIALDVSDPDSDQYGNFLTQEDLDKITAPRESDMQNVKKWLADNNLAFDQRGVSNLVITTSVRAASRALRTRFHTVSNNKYSQAIVRAAEYSVPDDVHQSIAAIFGLHGLPLPPTKPLVISSTRPGKPIEPVTPGVLASTYNINGVKVTGSAKNRQAVVEFQVCTP